MVKKMGGLLLLGLLFLSYGLGGAGACAGDITHDAAQMNDNNPSTETVATPQICVYVNDATGIEQASIIIQAETPDDLPRLLTSSTTWYGAPSSCAFAVYEPGPHRREYTLNCGNASVPTAPAPTTSCSSSAPPPPATSAHPYGPACYVSEPSSACACGYTMLSNAVCSPPPSTP